MPKIKDIPKIDRPREKFLKKGPEALSKSDLLAILLGSGIKGKNVQKLSQQIIKKFGMDFLNITVDDLQKVSGIGQAKALQIASAISLVKRFYKENNSNEITIKNSKDVFALTYDLREKKKEHLICLYMNARNVLLRKETVSVGLLDKTLLHPREIFYPATELNAASVILVHNHPSGDRSRCDVGNFVRVPNSRLGHRERPNRHFGHGRRAHGRHGNLAPGRARHLARVHRRRRGPSKTRDRPQVGSKR